MSNLQGEGRRLSPQRGGTAATLRSQCPRSSASLKGTHKPQLRFFFPFREDGNQGPVDPGWRLQCNPGLISSSRSGKKRELSRRQRRAIGFWHTGKAERPIPINSKRAAPFTPAHRKRRSRSLTGKISQVGQQWHRKTSVVIRTGNAAAIVPYRNTALFENFFQGIMNVEGKPRKKIEPKGKNLKVSRRKQEETERQ
jgi:hypothetical protein